MIEALPGDNSKKGLLRIVNVDVQFNSAGFELGWRAVGDQRFFLNVEPSLLETSITLREFSRELIQNRSPEICRKLDRTILKLLEITKALHQRDRGLGMLTADNIILVGGSSEEILLLDHGFYFTGESLPPQWISMPPQGAGLWDLPIQKQQQAALPGETFSAVSDVHLLARLIQGTLIDVWQKEILTGQDLRSQKEWNTNSNPLWRNLGALNQLSSETGALDELDRRLKSTLPSAHFTQADSSSAGGGGNKPKNFGFAKAVLVLLLSGCLGVGGAWYMKLGPFEVVQVDTGVDDNTVDIAEPIPPEANSAVEAALEEHPSEEGNLQADVDALKAATEATFSKDVETEKAEHGRISSRYGKMLETWDVRFLKANKELEQESTRKQAFEELKTLRDVLSEVKKLKLTQLSSTTSEKEDKCTGAIQNLQNDLRLPVGFRESLSGL